MVFLWFSTVNHVVSLFWILQMGEIWEFLPRNRPTSALGGAPDSLWVTTLVILAEIHGHIMDYG
jgi:hypothetical protein